MTQPYSFNKDQMNEILEEIYRNIINIYKSLKDDANFTKNQLVGLLSVIASNFAPIIKYNKN